jgi:hypothetical protein
LWWMVEMRIQIFRNVAWSAPQSWAVGNNVRSNNRIIPIEQRVTGERGNANIADESNAVMNSRFYASLDQLCKKFFLFAMIKRVQDE